MNVPLGLKRFWIAIRSSLWFVPSCMLLGAIGLGVVAVYIDETYTFELTSRYPRVFGANAEGARGILGAIAGSMITVAGVTFSMTIVALSLAANQYTPRILRNYMRDRGNKMVLGVFVSVFAYCLVVLRTIRGGEEEFIPSIALIGGMVLSLVAIGFLIYFVHHISSIIQPPTILSNIYNETIATLQTLYPKPCEATAPDSAADHSSLPTGASVPSRHTGYLQDFDRERLIAWAEEHQVVLQMECGIGEFVSEGAPLLRIRADKEFGDDPADQLNVCYSISTFRTIEQDPAFGVRQIADMALKALSPGINDTTTALGCIDYLGAIIYALGSHHIPAQNCHQNGQLRLITRHATYEFLVDEALHDIRQCAGHQTSIYLRLLGALRKAAVRQLPPERRAVLWKHAILIAEAARSKITVGHDRDVLNNGLMETAGALGMDYGPHLLS